MAPFFGKSTVTFFKGKDEGKYFELVAMLYDIYLNQDILLTDLSVSLIKTLYTQAVILHCLYMLGPFCVLVVNKLAL